MRSIYFDNAATTKVDPRVLKAMLPYLKNKYGNPSSVYQLGQEARTAVVESRERIAKFLNASSEEIIFTSCSTESVNFSHKGLIEAVEGKHLLTTKIEHKAVIEACRHLERQGCRLSWLSADRDGLISLKEIEELIDRETVLVSVMFVNNEVGTIEPIAETGQLLKKINQKRKKLGWPPVYFHCDATQAIQYLDCDVQKLGVDLLSLTGHKFHAPKGVGALYVRSGTPLVRQQDGGGQEDNLRAGTENVAYIVALGKAIEIIEKEKEKAKQVEKLRDKLIKGVLAQVKKVSLTGHLKNRAPHIASFVVEGVEGEAMLLSLDEKGIAASSGSACTSGELKPSHVLLAMGISAERAHGSLRISLSKYNTEEEVDYFLKVFPGIVKRLRKMSPLT